MIQNPSLAPNVAYVCTSVSYNVMIMHLSQLTILIVYAACYGVESQNCSDGSWLCQRCLAGANRADCCLCLLRGGALKPTDGGRWAHITCALAIPEVTLGGGERKQPVMTEDITRARRKLVSDHIM